jgi:transcriptional regulator
MTKKKQVIKLWEMGLSKAEIGRIVKMLHQNVSRIIKEYELEKAVNKLKQ